MSWQVAIVLVIIASSVLPLFTRTLTLRHSHAFFTIGLSMYAAVATVGFVISFLGRGGIPPLPVPEAWPYIVLEGICIPMAWLIMYKIVGMIGASNAALANSANIVLSVIAGVIVLHEGVSWKFLLGAACIIVAMLLALTIRADKKHASKGALGLKVLLLLVGAVLYAIGMLTEKQAISMIGVWDYALYGWTAQAMGVGVIVGIFGWREFRRTTPKVLQDGFILGLLTSVAGGLYIYALSKGTLSGTMLAISAKIALTMVLATIFLGERNNIEMRFLAFVCTIIGLALVL
ncbi:MAG: hypothetical protein QG629_355 [Patescibacteria group bacterium]|nr:EamA family transporter [Candidatus Saccharibacteria bacterium]MDQ5963273.1 hypothetical protein [Patescibacteria group bacterium]